MRREKKIILKFIFFNELKYNNIFIYMQRQKKKYPFLKLKNISEITLNFSRDGYISCNIIIIYIL